MKIPTAPFIQLILSQDQTLPESTFLRTARANYNFHYPNGTISKPCTVDQLIRKSMDAVTVLAWFKDEDDEVCIYLRSCFRATVSIRDYTPTGIPEKPGVGNMWELPAGLIDADEVGMEGVLAAGARELYEELGFKVEPSSLSLLGPRVFSSGGSCPERIFMLHVKVDPISRVDPPLDGSPFEAFGEVIPVRFEAALEATRTGDLYDGKTEILLRRFKEMVLEPD